MLLDADIFTKILKGNVKPLNSSNCPNAIETIFGWVIMKNVGFVSSPQVIGNSIIPTSYGSIDYIFRWFWAL